MVIFSASGITRGLGTVNQRLLGSSEQAHELRWHADQLTPLLQAHIEHVRVPANDLPRWCSREEELPVFRVLRKLLGQGPESSYRAATELLR